MRIRSLLTLMALAAIAILPSPAQARAKVTGLVGGTGYIEATLDGADPGWLYIIWAYDVQNKQLYKSPVTTTTQASVTVTCEVPVEERHYQVLVIQVKPAGVPEAAPATVNSPPPDTVTTMTQTSMLRDELLRSVAQASPPASYGEVMVAQLESDQPPEGFVPPASGVIVLEPHTRDQVNQMTLDPATNTIKLQDQVLVDLTAEAAKADSLNLQGNQLLPGVLLSSADGAAGGTMVVSILDQVATSVDILRSSFGEPIYKAAGPQFSRDQLETARKVLSAFKAEALKDYERQLEEHRQAEARRARESLVRDAFSK